MSRQRFHLLGILALVLLACAPAVIPTVAPATLASVVPATATLQRPPPSGSVTPQPSPTAPPSAVAATTKPKYGGTVTMYIRREPIFDPIKSAAAQEARQVQHAVFSSLLDSKWPDKCEVEMIGDAAKSWAWIDDKTMEVKLNPGVKFHDKAPVNGRELTAEDVVYSFNRLMSAQSVAISKDYMQYVTNIEALDKYTVRFHLSQPYAPFERHVLQSQYGAVILAREAGGPREDWNRPEASYIGSGPFSLESYMPGVSVTLAKHGNYFKKGVPYIDKLRMLFMPDTTTRQAAFRAGKLDFQQEIPGPFVDEIEKTMPQVGTARCGTGSGAGIHFRTDSPPFNDVKVRRAVSMAINREAMLNNAMGGAGENYGLASSTMWTAIRRDEFPPESRRYLEYHPDEARKLLVEAGYPQGLEISTWSTQRWASPRTQMFESAIEMLLGAGFKIRENRWLESTASVNTVGVGDYPPGVVAFYAVTLNTPYDLTSLAYGKNPPSVNRSRINDPVVDKIIEELFQTYDSAKASALSRNIQITLVEEAYVIMFPQLETNAAWHPWIRNFGGSQYFHYDRGLLERIWVER